MASPENGIGGAPNAGAPSGHAPDGGAPAGQAAISPTAPVEHALRLLATNPAAAECQAREILKVLPQDARAIFIVGAARRRAGDAAGARAVLEPLAKAIPNSAFAQHELGPALAGLGESAAAA